jgi:hypothetical protein
MYNEMVTRLKLFTNEELAQLKIALQNEIGEREAKLQKKALEDINKVIKDYKEKGIVFFTLDEYKMHPNYLDISTIQSASLCNCKERTK